MPQRGAGVEVVFPAGAALETVGPAGLLAGEGLAAIGIGAGWELFQYGEAELIEANRWRLGGLLRGQCGTEPLIPDA
ncbi:GTA baseplate fiber-binding domain-containing protein, partial [Klebsiella pneumoniae]|uniref:GTA baseplate fiber-binding domain-containing protein n=1 Tax=Klebsiella pneumoniae TaxID=573 RepID=UPI003F806647